MWYNGSFTRQDHLSQTLENALGFIKRNPILWISPSSNRPCTDGIRTWQVRMQWDFKKFKAAISADHPLISFMTIKPSEATCQRGMYIDKYGMHLKIGRNPFMREPDFDLNGIVRTIAELTRVPIPTEKEIAWFKENMPSYWPEEQKYPMTRTQRPIPHENGYYDHWTEVHWIDTMGALRDNRIVMMNDKGLTLRQNGFFAQL